MIPWLPAEPEFPPLDAALTEPNGLLAAGGDLSPRRLLAAYRRGIFPWYSSGEPILWWSPDPRMVMAPTEIRIHRSLARVLRNSHYEVRLDCNFPAVMAACASAPRDGQSGTWITLAMQEAYGELHRLGYAHSVETWVDGELVGGLYGIALGAMFFGESMFSVRRDSSKIALAHLCAFLEQRGFGIIDCQMETRHLATLGAHPIPRSKFVSALDTYCVRGDVPERWPILAINGRFRSAA